MFLSVCLPACLAPAAPAQGKSWSGKYESDNLWGHKAGVKALKLLPSQGVLLTGADRHLWQGGTGLGPNQPTAIICSSSSSQQRQDTYSAAPVAGTVSGVCSISAGMRRWQKAVQSVGWWQLQGAHCCCQPVATKRRA